MYDVIAKDPNMTMFLKLVNQSPAFKAIISDPAANYTLLATRNQGFPVTIPADQTGAKLTETLKKHVLLGAETMQEVINKSYNGFKFERLAGKPVVAQVIIGDDFVTQTSYEYVILDGGDGSSVSQDRSGSTPPPDYPACKSYVLPVDGLYISFFPPGR